MMPRTPDIETANVGLPYARPAMALFFSRAEEVETIDDPRARLVIYRIGSSTLVTRVEGHGSVTHIQRLQRRSEELIARVGSIEVVHDWFALTSYDGQVRQKMTPWAIRTRASHRAIHIGTSAGIVRMGVTMVRLATNAPIHAYDSLAALEVALADIIARRAP